MKRGPQGAPQSGGSETRTIGVRSSSLAALGIAVIEADAQGGVVRMNSVAELLTGWSIEEARGKLLDIVFPLSRDADEYGPLSLGAPSVRSGPMRDVQQYLVNRHGQRHAIELNIETMSGVDGTTTVVLAQDVTEQRLNALRLLHLSVHDTLTGLVNRAQFVHQLQRALAETGQGRQSALVYIDIDRFRLVNDASGLDAGDTLLSWIGSLLREGIGRDDVCARLGGNEFGLLLRDVAIERAVEIAENIHERLREFRFAWRDHTFGVKSSIGIVGVRAEFDSPSELLGAVETASDRAKEQGGNRVYAYPSLPEAAEIARQQAVAWVSRIKENLESGRVELFCQPIVPLANAATNKPSSEILFRMLDPEGVPRGPQDVVRVAERYGLMDAIDQWVIRRTLRTLGGMRSRLSEIDHYSINLSATSLRQETLLGLIHEELERNGVPASKVCFEVTETAAVENLSEARWLMQELGSIGCRFSLDDFGTGMASYAYLRDLNVDYIKIDRSFVHDVDVSALSAAIVESTHHIAALIGARSVAEGVETRVIADKLTALGLDYGQGYFFGRPAPL